MDRRRQLLRSIPSVEKVLGHPEVVALGTELPRWAVTDAARVVLDDIRRAISDGNLEEEPQMSAIVERLKREAVVKSARGIRRVINATGVVIHTNLGRSILSDQAMQAVQEVGKAYSTLEFDVSTGKRTSRTKHVEDLLTRIIGCEAAFVVNNNAGAVLLALNTLSDGMETVVSRGELVEIGGSFRLPEVMNRSGAKMVEVGTTNRTRLDDYSSAITEATRVLLKVHLSNFEMRGFVESVSGRDLAALAQEHGLVMMEDLGSGALFDLSRIGLAKEPMPQEALAEGAGVVTFSGDKLMGGPQAGIIVGRRELISQIRTNPLARALRIGKFTLAALEETLRHYLEPALLPEKVATLRMLAYSPEELRVRAGRVVKALSGRLAGILRLSVAEETSQAGGGSLPAAGLRTFAMSISSDRYSANHIVSVLRECQIPIVARIAENNVLIDFRTVQPSEDEIVIQQIVAAFAGGDS